MLEHISALTFLLISVSLLGQDSTHSVDTIFTGDTIIRDRTIEKVVYVYGISHKYTAIGLYATTFQPSIQGSPKEETSSLAFGSGLFIQHNRNKFIYEIGLGYKQLKRSFENTYPSIHYKKSQTLQEEILSSYLITINGITERKYITQTSLVDTTLAYTKDSSVSHTNAYSYFEMPIIIGREIRYGFLCLDAKAGVIPSFIFIQNSENRLHSEQVNSYEKNHINKFGCDLTARFSFRYLLTFNSLISLDLFGNYPLLPLTKQSAGYTNRKIEAGLQLSLSYLISQVD